MIRISRVTSDHSDFKSLVRVLDDELYLRYLHLQDSYNPKTSVEGIETAVVGYIENVPMACGCFKINDDKSVEIKRMLVKPGYRGSGIAPIVLQELENWAIELGYSMAVLETGKMQPEAIRFYTKMGYNVIENFGPYIGNEQSVCMGKSLIS